MQRRTNSFANIILQDEPSRLLRRSFEKGRIAQTYLFAGKSSVGKRTVAESFAALLQCNSPVGCEDSLLDSCGHCENCKRIFSGSHPDVRHITPNGNEIKIDQVRLLQDMAVLKPILGCWHIFIVDPADKLNQNSANALLKTLEEAPSHSVFILLASDTNAVLPTILSRSEIVRFNSPSHQQVREALQKNNGMRPEEAAACYSLSEGKLGLSLAMADGFVYKSEALNIKKSHTGYLLQLKLFTQFLEDYFSRVTTLESAVDKAWKLEDLVYQPLRAARKAFCRSLFMNVGLPKAFPLLFSKELIKTIESVGSFIEKNLGALLAENKKAYPSAVIKDIESQIAAAASIWGSSQLEKLLLCLMNFYSDAMKYASGANETLLLNLDHKEDIITVARVEGLALLRSRIDMLEKSVGLLRRYIQPLLILENVITQIGGPEA